MADTISETGVLAPLERAARALWQESKDAGNYRSDTWEDETEHDQRVFATRARAVLEAIRQPSDAMIRAGEAWQAHCSDLDSLFSEMIGVAIHGPNC